MGKSLNDDYRMGQLVVSKRGKDAGQRYVIVGFLDGELGHRKRLALADAVKFNVSSPKLKNPKHVEPQPHIMDDVAECVKAGKNINRGELCRFLENVRAFAIGSKTERQGS